MFHGLKMFCVNSVFVQLHVRCFDEGDFAQNLR